MGPFRVTLKDHERLIIFPRLGIFKAPDLVPGLGYIVANGNGLSGSVGELPGQEYSWLLQYV